MLTQHKVLMDDQGARDLGSCFHFIPDIKYLGERKTPLQSQPLPSRQGTGRLGVLGWQKHKASQELAGLLCHRGLTWYLAGLDT